MAELFGFSIKRSQKELGTNEKSFASPAPDDGSIEVAGGGFFGQVLDTDGREKTDLELIKRYRDISQQSECDTAIEDIVNEGIVANQEDIPVQISLDKVPYSDKIKRKIRTEFEEVLRLFDFNVKGHDIFRRWYVDGRLYYQKIIDSKNPRKGISELRYLEATKIKKVRENDKKIDPKTGIEMITKVTDYFVYNDKGIQSAGMTGTGANQGVKIAADTITYVPSGIIDSNSGRVMSYLHKAIKPVNQLRMIEDSLVIYRISRAPERRIFYIDVGNLPKVKAEQYLKDVMNSYRNKMVYDAKLVKFVMIVIICLCWKISGSHEEKVVEVQRFLHCLAVLILEKLMTLTTFKENYIVHLTCRYHDSNLNQDSLWVDLQKLQEMNSSLQSSYNGFVRSSLPYSQTFSKQTYSLKVLLLQKIGL